jgi:hypothetical protein
MQRAAQSSQVECSIRLVQGLLAVNAMLRIVRSFRKEQAKDLIEVTKHRSSS